MNSARTPAEARYLIQFFHPSKILAMFPPISGAAVAAQMGIPLAQYEGVLADFA